MTNASALVGIVLAAGQGARMGAPKALLRDDTGTPWLEIATTRMLDAGCDTVFVVLGASATHARALLPVDSRVIPVINPRFASGISHSLRAGMHAAAQTPAIATMITLLDLPRMPASVVERVLNPAGGADFLPLGPRTLRRAVYGGIPGHPALIGRAHWEDLELTLRGDSGALRYLIEHHALVVECGDLFDGRDSDTPADEPASDPGGPRIRTDEMPDELPDELFRS